MITLDCRLVAEEFFTWAAAERARLARPPRLATVLYRPREDAGSRQYRDLLLRDAQRLGMEVERDEPADETSLLACIDRLNADAAVTGVMVFYPIGLPGLSDDDLMDRVSPRKDIEGLHSLNLGYLIKYKRFLDAERGLKCVVPATAKAVVKALQRYQARIDGAFAVIINNSMRVGKPLGLMLENLGATVVKCYDRTDPETLMACVRRADLLVTAVPDPAFRLDPAWVKPGAAVVDVSYQGNIDTEALRGVAALGTVPQNRIGQVTRALLFVNMIYCAQTQEAHDAPQTQGA